MQWKRSLCLNPVISGTVLENREPNLPPTHDLHVILRQLTSTGSICPVLSPEGLRWIPYSSGWRIKFLMIHYSNQCHLLLLHLMGKAPNWDLEDPNVISISPEMALALTSRIVPNPPKLGCLSLQKHQPFQLCYPLLSPCAVCWACTDSALDRETELMKWHWANGEDLAPRERSEPSCLSFPPHKIADVPCSCARYRRSHIWKTSSSYADCRCWDGDWETKTPKWIPYLMGERHSPQGCLLMLFIVLGALAP